MKRIIFFLTKAIFQKLIILFFALTLASTLSACSSSTNSFSYDPVDEENIQENYISKEEAISSSWIEIKRYLTGTEAIEACTNGTCYGLDAELFRGSVDLIYFNNGGRLHFGESEFNSKGYAYGSDADGNNWEFILDMKRSGLVKKAVQKWANSNNLLLE